jgi:hypothetical protein
MGYKQSKGYATGRMKTSSKSLHMVVSGKVSLYFMHMKYCDANLEDNIEGKCRTLGLLVSPNATNKKH